MRTRGLPGARVAGGALFGAALALCACEGIPIDRFPSPKGNAPALLGVLEGSVVYIGPRPLCARDEVGHAVSVRGRVVMLLFAYDNPPPPNGSATSAVSLLSIPGAEIFELADCMPESPGPDDLAFISRSVDFLWPQLAMGGSYQVRGFYDNDGDFVPFFNVRRTPTAGDVAGGAFVNATALPPVFERFTFDAAEDRPQGQVIHGAVVSLAAPLSTEPPLFRMTSGVGGMASTTTLPFTTDPVAFDTALFAASQARLELIDADDDDGADFEAYDPVLRAAGLDFELRAPFYSFYVRPVDVDNDGTADPHPLLGSAGFPWQFPTVLMRRAQTRVEIEGGVPPVLLITALRPTQVAAQTVFGTSIDVLVPPIAAVDLLPGDSACRVPYVPPGNLTIAYEGRPVECQELPSGRYTLSLLHGVAAGVPQASSPPTSDTGFDLAGGLYSSQAWTIPNEMGPPDLRYDPSAVPQLDPALLVDESTPDGQSSVFHEQGPNGRFVIFDPSPSDGVRHDCEMAPDPLLGGAPREIVFEPVPERCCAAVAHLCGVPLCEVETDAEDRDVREAAGSGALSCVPFLMPASCCE